MTGTATRYLYLARHGEAAPDGSGLTANGRRRAILLGERLRDISFSTVHHGPLPRATQTAHLIADLLNNVPLHVTDAAGDFVPCVPTRDELPPDSAQFLLDFLDQVTDEEREQGPVLARQALEQFTGPVDSDKPSHQLLVTHNFLISWLVQHALDAPSWRWLSLNHCNAALTVIRYTPGRPSAVLTYNDMSHLPTTLRWTGFPPDLTI